MAGIDFGVDDLLSSPRSSVPTPAISLVSTPRRRAAGGALNLSMMSPRAWGKQPPAAPAAATIESFAKRVNAALRAPPPPPHRAPTDASAPEAAASPPKVPAIVVASACREVAQQAVGAAEVLELQRMARELCRRPLEYHHTKPLVC